MTDVQFYLGRQERQSDVSDAERMAGLAALLDHDVPPWAEGVLPPLGHWLCFRSCARQSLIGADGHPLRGVRGLLPAVDLPRRMWAGSRVRFLADIPLGTPIERISTVVAVAPKEGRSGKMLFVTIRHEIAPSGGAMAIMDEHDIVYREAAVAGVPIVRPTVGAGAPEPISRTVTPDPVMLFRYSAVTFNGHRIHYDRDYCRDVEAYSGLVVHGPLVATLMLDHLLRYRPRARIGACSFRAISPLFDNEDIRLGLTETPDGASLRAVGPAGPAMTAVADYAA